MNCDKICVNIELISWESSHSVKSSLLLSWNCFRLWFEKVIAYFTPRHCWVLICILIGGKLEEFMDGANLFHGNFTRITSHWKKTLFLYTLFYVYYVSFMSLLCNWFCFLCVYEVVNVVHWCLMLTRILKLAD